MNKFFGFALASAALLIFGAATSFAQPNQFGDPRLCARTMCGQMRTCSTYVPQPTPVYDKTEKPDGTTSPKVTKSAKGSETAQGQSEGTCRSNALQFFYGCSYSEGGPGLVEPNTKSKSGNVVVPMAPAK